MKRDNSSNAGRCYGNDNQQHLHQHHHHHHDSDSLPCKPRTKRARRSQNGSSSSNGVMKDHVSGAAASNNNNAHSAATAATGNNNAQNRRSSVYRGVTRHRWTGRYEAHLWDKNCWNQGQNKKGRQVYLGAYDDEEAAAHTYDLAALKYWGTETVLNFPLSTYTKELEEMMNVSREEYLASLRRRSSGFSRGVSKYRGVARHHHNGRWEARIGRVLGNKYLYLGTYSTQEEAATAYDMAAIEYRGLNAVTNFDLSRYIGLLSKSTTTAAAAANNNNKTAIITDPSSQNKFPDETASSPPAETAAATGATASSSSADTKPNVSENVDLIKKTSNNNSSSNSSNNTMTTTTNNNGGMMVVGTEMEISGACSSFTDDDFGLFFSESGSEHMLCSEPELYLSSVEGDGAAGGGAMDVEIFHETLDSLCGSDLLEELVDPFLDAIQMPSFPNIAIRTCS